MLGVSTVRRIVSVRTVRHVPTPLATAIALMDTEVLNWFLHFSVCFHRTNVIKYVFVE